MNPSRRGYLGQLVTHLIALGVEPITGKPGKPTTQGKNERFHRTLLRFLDKQPLAETIAELQQQVDRFDVIYNTQRPHQGLPGRVTPQQAWDATDKVTPPRPRTPSPDLSTSSSPHPDPTVSSGIRTTKVRPDGTVRARRIEFRLGAAYAGQLVHVITNTATIKFYDHQGTLVIEHPWPPPGTTYVGNRTPPHNRMSPMS